MLKEAADELTGYKIHTGILSTAYGLYALKTGSLGISPVMIMNLSINGITQKSINYLQLAPKLSSYHPRLPQVTKVTVGLIASAAIDYTYSGKGLYSLGYLVAEATTNIALLAATRLTQPLIATHPKSSHLLQQMAADTGTYLGYRIVNQIHQHAFTQKNSDDQKQEQSKRNNHQQKKNNEKNSKHHSQDKKNKYHHERKSKHHSKQHKKQERAKQPDPFDILANERNCKSSPSNCCTIALKRFGFTASKQPSQKDLKKSFRKMMTKNHPDRCNTLDCEEKAISSNNAYEILKSSTCKNFMKK